MKFTCIPVGDRAISLQFEQVITPNVNQKVIEITQWITENRIRGITELVPAYASLLVYYNPLEITFRELITIIQTYEAMENRQKNISRLVTIPTLYGGEWGPDLDDVAQMNRVTVEEVIKLHSGTTYRVYMLGFSPGFPYLGGLPVAIHTPRLDSPRPMVRAGSIGIAGSQTGIYSLSTPGGWRVIAHTPLRLFDLSRREEPFLLRAGDHVRFASISKDEYQEIVVQIQLNTYQPKIANTVEEDGK